MTNRPGVVEFETVGSHVGDDQVGDKMWGRTQAAKSGNDRADETACHAAGQSAVNEGKSASLYMRLGKAKKVHYRIFAIEPEVARTRGTSKRPNPICPKDAGPDSKHR